MVGLLCPRVHETISWYVSRARIVMRMTQLAAWSYEAPALSCVGCMQPDIYYCGSSSGHQFDNKKPFVYTNASRLEAHAAPSARSLPPGQHDYYKALRA